MTTSRTSTAMSTIPKNMPSGLIGRVARYTYSGATITASSNALQVEMLPIPNSANIVQLMERHSSGANTMTAKLGLEVTSGNRSLSALGSGYAQAANNFVSPMLLPYQVACPDDQVTQYAKLIASMAPGTATSQISIAVALLYTMDSV